MLTQMQNAGLMQDRRREHRDPERRRSQNVAPPSPALVRNGSKQRRLPTTLTPTSANVPGQFAPYSAVAQVNVSIGTPQPINQHPYANPGSAGYDYIQDPYVGHPQYGRASPMVSSVGAAPALTTVRPRGEEAGMSHGDRYNDQIDDDVNSKPGLLRILTCRC